MATCLQLLKFWKKKYLSKSRCLNQFWNWLVFFKTSILGGTVALDHHLCKILLLLARVCVEWNQPNYQILKFMFILASILKECNMSSPKSELWNLSLSENMNKEFNLLKTLSPDKFKWFGTSEEPKISASLGYCQATKTASLPCQTFRFLSTTQKNWRMKN